MSKTMSSQGMDAENKRVIDGSDARRLRLRRRRALKDGVSRYGVGAGGIGVIVALGLIFVYLFYETFPMLKPVSVDIGTEYALPAAADAVETLHLSVDRFEEIGARFLDDGRIVFFDARTGALRDTLTIPTDRKSVV